MAFERSNLLIGIATVVLTAAGVGYAVYANRTPTVVSEESEFYCSKVADPQQGGET